LKWGSSWGPLSLDGQWWRMFSAMFVHDGLEHILVNMCGLWVLGRRVEPAFGQWSFLLLYLISGLTGAVSTLAMRPERFNCGASGAVFGIMGVFIAAMCTGRLAESVRTFKRRFWPLPIFLGLSLYAGVADGHVNNSAHVGGLLAGLTMGLLLSRGAESARLRTRVFGGGIILLAAATALVRNQNGWVVSLQVANDALAAGKLDDAARNFTMVLEKRPNDIAASLGMGQICLRKTDYSCAESFLNRTLVADPTNNYAEYLLGTVYLRTGRFDDVLEISQTLFLRGAIGPDEQVLFAAALDGKGNHALAGDRYLKLRRYDDAITAFAKALQQKTDDENSKRGLIQAYRAKGMNDEADAVEKTTIPKNR